MTKRKKSREDQIRMDLFSGRSGQGQIAEYLNTHSKLDFGRKRPFLNKKGIPCAQVYVGGNPKHKSSYKTIQVNEATLLPYEWKEIDDAVVRVSQERLTGWDYLVGKGLTRPLKNALASTILEWSSISDSQEAIMSMDAESMGQNDQVHYKDYSLPIPVLHADWSISLRKLEASRQRGTGVDVEEAENAARRIREKKEDLLFGSDAAYTYGGGTLYSFLNYPDRSPVTLSLSWTDSAKTPAQILADVVAMKNAAIEDKQFGNFVLFIPTLWDAVLDEDYSVSGSSIMTIRQRLMQISGLTDIVVVDRLAADNALLIQLSTKTVELMEGLPLQNIEWKTEGGWKSHYKAVEIAVNRIKSDYNGKTGIIHLA